MRRFESLNVETQDVVNCILPAVAKAFGLDDPVDIIPVDIRMRAWDSARRDHIKDETENDPRNWGVQFLKDLMVISRLCKGNLTEFQTELRAKVKDHTEKHPWAQLADIREIRLDYEQPQRKLSQPEPEEVEEESSDDSYLEELVDAEPPKGVKRGRGEMYEVRTQAEGKRRRLRRAQDGSFLRPDERDKKSRRQQSNSTDRYSSMQSTERGTPSVRPRASRTVLDDDEVPVNPKPQPSRGNPYPSHPTQSYTSMPLTVQSYIQSSLIDANRVPLDVQRLQAELEVAEAELKHARLKMDVIKAKELAAKEEATKKQLEKEYSQRQAMINGGSFQLGGPVQNAGLLKNGGSMKYSIPAPKQAERQVPSSGGSSKSNGSVQRSTSKQAERKARNGSGSVQRSTPKQYDGGVID